MHTIRVLINHYPKQTVDCLMNILGTHDTARILTVLGGIYCNNKDEMASENAYLNAENKQNSIEKLKMAAVLQFTLPGVPCIYYGDENGMEGHIDPFCRRCFDWEHLNEDLIKFYSILGKIRQENEVFKEGEFKEISITDGLLFYKRSNETENIYVYTNNSSTKYVLNLSGKYRSLLNGNIYDNKITVQPYSYEILKKE